MTTGSLIYKRVGKYAVTGELIEEKELSIQGKMTDSLEKVKEIFDEEWNSDDGCEFQEKNKK